MSKRLHFLRLWLSRFGTESERQIITCLAKECIPQNITEITGVSVRTIKLALHLYLEKVRSTIVLERPTFVNYVSEDLRKGLHEIQGGVCMRKMDRELAVNTDSIRSKGPPQIFSDFVRRKFRRLISWMTASRIYVLKDAAPFLWAFAHPPCRRALHARKTFYNWTVFQQNDRILARKTAKPILKVDLSLGWVTRLQ